MESHDNSSAAAFIAGFIIRAQQRRSAWWLGHLDDEEDNPQELLPNTRNVYPRKNQNESTWAHMLLDPRIQDPTTREGKLFRRRFRVPYPIYVYLLNICNEYRWFV